jgi:hypothetical protein
VRGLFGSAREKCSRVLIFVQKNLDSIPAARAILTAASTQIGAQTDDDAVGAAMIYEEDKLAIAAIVWLYTPNVGAKKDDGIRGP